MRFSRRRYSHAIDADRLHDHSTSRIVTSTDLPTTARRAGGARDQCLYAYDTRTGEKLAHFDLPAGLHAGPITYKLHPEGKQYLVVAPGGHTILGSKLGDYVMAYTLPD
jgi:glucose dehydrogenase